MDESTQRGSEVALLVYARCIDKGEFAEEMVFGKSLETTTSTSDIYGKLNNYSCVNNIPIENRHGILCCRWRFCYDGQKKGWLKLMKDEIPEKILVHCVIHRENLVAKNITPVLNEVLRSIIKCINYIKANAKCEQIILGK
ncbi:uncharacterized protein TNCV_3434211 [Trichonephila clavipes]|nr:uncharacterized protein TNCV_3434211 [Trichonephila clavipes]